MMRALLLSVLAVALVRPASAQQVTRDSLRLRDVLAQTMRSDPRAGQTDLLARQSELRLATLQSSRLPSFMLEGVAQHQSDVPTILIRVPTGESPPSPPKDTYDARLLVQQSVLDPALRARRALEQAQLAESQARVSTTLFALRDEAVEAFFTAALLQERTAEIATTLRDLEARLEEAKVRVRERVVLPGDAAAIEVAILQRRQDLAELQANRRAALAILAALTGDSTVAGATIATPAVASAFVTARARLTDIRLRPEHAQFTATRLRLQSQSELLAAQDRPRLNAFARLGYGKPGLKLMTNEPDAYWLAGVQAQWSPWNWRRTERERAELALQRESVDTEEQAFRLRLGRGVERDLANVDRLQAALALDDDIIALRQRIEGEARIRLDERVITAAEYVDRNTDLLLARLARSRHRIELLHAQTRFLNTLGLEVQ